MNANLRLEDLYGREKESETKLLALYVPKELTSRIDRLAKDLKAKKREVILALLLFLGRRSAVGSVLGRLGLEFVSHVPPTSTLVEPVVTRMFSASSAADTCSWIELRHE